MGRVLLAPQFLRVRFGRCVRLGACAALPPYLGVFWLVRPASTWASPAAGQRWPSAERLQKLGSSLSLEVSPEDRGGRKVCQLLSREHFPPKSCIFVNMVKTTAEHFSNVAETTGALSAAGFDPIPHLPISRLSTVEDFHLTLKMLTQAGAKHLLLVGGNDLPQRLERNELHYRSVADLLKAEIETIKSEGIQSVSLAGLPDSPQWRGWSEKAATKVLVDKARLVLQAGLKVVVATQFCFNPRHLLQWLRDATAALEELQKELGVAHRVSFRIGVPGPTRLRKLRRIADICQVPRDFLHPSMFDMALQGASRVSPRDLEHSFDSLGLGRTQRSATPELRATLFLETCGADGLLGRPELAELLCRDVQAEVPAAARPAATDAADAAAASGPSAFVAHEEEAAEDALLPEDMLWTAVAAQTGAAVDIGVNLYPFGGLADSLSLARALREGKTPGSLTEAA